MIAPAEMAADHLGRRSYLRPMAQLPLASLLERFGFDELNEMQQSALAATEQHPNVILLSPTGSGKTLAFLLSIYRSMKADVKTTQAMIVAPSRELALQIETVWKQLGTGMKVTCCYGGHKREIEEQSLAVPPALLVGTPGRIGDHLRRGNITADSIHTLVLDEFDKSLELGFVEEMRFVVESLKQVEQRVLTSATEAVEIPEWIGTEWVRLDFLPEEGPAKERLELAWVAANEKDKVDTLFKLICHLGGRSSVIFCNHRDAVERTSQLLTEKGLPNTFYHGAMEQRDRETALAKFRNGTFVFLVTTDLAARGLDIPHIRYIIHFHLPDNEQTFTHRNGRTARMEASGTAILIIGPDEKIPAYIQEEINEIVIPEDVLLPEKPKWTTLWLSLGKKDKVAKGDIVGFLTQKAGLKGEDVGLIEVKDFYSFAGVRRSKATFAVQAGKEAKLKGQKVKMEIAR